MKNTFTLTLLSLLLTVSAAFAQPGSWGEGGNHERIEAMKVAFITRQLELTPDEAKGFWPIYDQYQAEKKAARTEAKLDKMEAKLNWDNMTDAEAAEMLDRMIENKEKEVALLKKYNNEFKRVIPVTKVAKLYRAELDFKRVMMQEIKERRESGGGPGGGHMGPGGGRRF